MGKMPETCKTHHKKSTKLETEKRIYEISKLLLQGVSRQGILLYAQEKSWGVSERQVAEYTSKCYRIWKKENESNRQADIAWHIEARRDLFNRCIEEKEFGCAKDVIIDLTKLRGYYPAEKRTLSNDDGQPFEIKIITMTDEEAKVSDGS